MKHVCVWGAVLWLGCWSTAVFGWGTQSTQAVVRTAVRVVAKDGTMPLGALTADVEAGGSLSDSDLARRFPDFVQNPVNAIETQMFLLQAVRGERIDSYFAYRLGVLGALVARASAPLFGADPGVQQEYHEDVARVIDRVSLQGAPRRFLDPQTYFAELQRATRTSRELIAKEYLEGSGFDGLARASLPEDFSRSVAAVADAWHTVISSATSLASVSDGQIRDYILGSVAFYLDRGNPQSAFTHYEHLATGRVATADLRKEVGDLFFDAGAFNYALEEYEKVRAVDPGRRDVVERVAEYHMRIGEEALNTGGLVQARDEFAAAIEVDRLHPTAQARLLDVERMIAERQARLDATKLSIEEAQNLVAESERLMMARDFAQAGRVLEQAALKYQQVGPEFPAEARIASTALREIAVRRGELQTELVRNAQTLSGAGSIVSARGWAAEAQGFSEQGLRNLQQQAFQQQLDRLSEEQ